jgi:hypothetical protein
MLLPSILQILDQSKVQSKKAVKKVESGFEAEMIAATEEISGVEKIELAGADAADPAKPPKLDSQIAGKPPARQSLEELLRIITKFQKSNQKPVVDVFE